MRKLVMLFSFLFLIGNIANAQGGHYKGGKGSSHKGGHYKNAATHDHYRKRK